MKVDYSRKAVKQLKKLSRQKQIVVLRRIQRLKSDPQAGKRLKGELADFRSLKVWPYRILYRYSSQKKILLIDVIQHRQGVYKKS